jgi:hypothetical protein
MNDLSPAERLAKYRAVEEWLVWQLGQTRRKIRDLEQPPPTAYVIEPKQHPRHPQPALIHTADCTMPQRDTSPVKDDQARIALTKGGDDITGCEFCNPGASLGLDT